MPSSITPDTDEAIVEMDLTTHFTWLKRRDQYGRLCRDLYRNGRHVAVIIRLPKVWIEKYGTGYLVNDLTMPAVPQDAEGKLTYFPPTRSGLADAAAHALRCGR
jgi:hypothetical protein